MAVSAGKGKILSYFARLAKQDTIKGIRGIVCYYGQGLKIKP